VERLHSLPNLSVDQRPVDAPFSPSHFFHTPADHSIAITPASIEDTAKLECPPSGVPEYETFGYVYQTGPASLEEQNAVVLDWHRELPSARKHSPAARKLHFFPLSTTYRSRERNMPAQRLKPDRYGARYRKSINSDDMETSEDDDEMPDESVHTGGSTFPTH